MKRPAVTNQTAAASTNTSQTSSVTYLEAVAHGSNPTAATVGQRMTIKANRHGIPFVLGGHPNIISKEFEFTAT